VLGGDPMTNVATKLGLIVVTTLLAGALAGCVAESTPTLADSFEMANSAETFSAPLSREMVGVNLAAISHAGEAIEDGPVAE
jgi:hypothetical protein